MKDNWLHIDLDYTCTKNDGGIYYFPMFPIYRWLLLMSSAITFIRQNTKMDSRDSQITVVGALVKHQVPRVRLGGSYTFFCKFLHLPLLILLSRFPCKIPVSYDLEPSLCLLIERVPLYSACGHWQMRDQFI